MTAQNPTPQAGGVSALLASFLPAPPPPGPVSADDFLAAIQQALSAQPSPSDGSSSSQSTKDSDKSSDGTDPQRSTETPLDINGASLLLALLAPPLPMLAAPLLHKAARGGGSAGNTSVDRVETAPNRTNGDGKDAKETKSEKTAEPDKVPRSPLQLVPSKEPDTEEAAQAEKAPANGKLPVQPLEFPLSKELENKATALSGTSAANTSQRMSLMPERNEIAGRVEQKMPIAPISAVASADTGGPSSDGGAKSSLTFSWHDSTPENLTITGLPGVTAPDGTSFSPSAVLSTPEVAVSAPSNAALDRLEQMISHEVLVVRQSGANSLGVSLKLDANTQLYLQLTTHNGSVQASVRLERGSFAPEEAQWAQLQQSLARQNVALMPMSAGSNAGFQQSPQDQSRRSPIALEDWPSSNGNVQPSQQRKQKEQGRSRKNWESWA